MKKELIWEWIEKFEQTNNENKINEQVVQKLWELIRQGDDIYLIREKYKGILENLKKNDTNYYAHICIALNVLESKKGRLLEDLISIENIKYIRQRMAGELTTKIGNKETTIRHIIKEVEYDYIDFPEAIGNEKTTLMLDEIKKEAEIILSKEMLDLDKAKIWVKEYRKYIIMTYGRWSKQYEQYMNTAFEIPLILISPNLMFIAMRATMKKGIETAIANI